MIVTLIIVSLPYQLPVYLNNFQSTLIIPSLPFTALQMYGTAESRTFFMYLRAIFCTFQISVDFYFVPMGGRGEGRGGAGEGEGARMYTIWVHLVC